MTADTARLETLMADAVEVSVRHVESGGVPFVGLLVADDGWVSDPGVNLVRETGDPTAHAEVIAMRKAVQAGDRSSLEGVTLLATGEPCALCYRVAARHGIAVVCFAVDRDTAAEWGFDYRAGYETGRLPLAVTARHLNERTSAMHWFYLGIAVVFEIAVAVAAGKAQGFTRPAWTTATLVSGGIATYLLSLALLTFDVGVGYAIWTSVAGVGIVVLGALFFGQRLDWRKLLGIAAVIAGVVGLQLSGAA